MCDRLTRRFGSLRILSFSWLSLALTSPFNPQANAQNCGEKGIAVQVLGSGGPELQDKRASSSYLVWQGGQARVLIDAGGGSALRFGESGAKMSQLDVMLFTHLHVDHSADFPSLMFSSWFEQRNRPLPVYGPDGNKYFPSTVDFVHAFFNNRDGIYRYLSALWLRKRTVVTSCSLTILLAIQRRLLFKVRICPPLLLGSSMAECRL
jgi:hypothetical protein